MCEITTEERQITTSQRSKSGKQFEGNTLLFQTIFETVHRLQTEVVKWTVKRQVEVLEYMKR
jgi:hypothetical protein